MTTFRLDLMDFSDNVIESELQFAELEYSRKFGSVGALVVSFPSDYYSADLFGRDSILKLYRTPANGHTSLEPSAVWFTRKIGFDYDNKIVTVTCVDQMDLLRRRIVGYRGQTVLADKTVDEGTEGAADDLMKQYVKENMGVDAVVDGTGVYDSARDLSTYLSVEDEKSLGPTVEMSAAYQQVSRVLDSIRDKSVAAGTELYYDVTVKSGGTFEFVTPLSAIGTYSSQELRTFTFNPLDGNLARLVVERDYSDEVTFVYVTAGGTGSGMHYITVSSGREELTPFNRIEAHIGEDENNDDYLEEVGDAFLEGAKPIARVEADIIDSPMAVYGRDFNYGDRVSVVAYGYTFDCFINAIRNRVSGGQENLKISLYGEVPI